MNIQHIRQREPYDCAVAVLAMLGGKSYEESRGYFGSHDFSKEGISDRWVEFSLAHWGFAIRPLYKFFNNVERSPWPPLPFAPAHLCQVVVCEGARTNHYVVMLRDGRVLDPLSDEPKTLAGYWKVNHVVGVWSPPLALGE